MAGVSEIKSFLDDVKNADSIDIVSTDKNKRTRYSIGLTVFDQEEIIRNLRVVDYYKGPEKDRNPKKTGDIWIFKHNYNEHVLYIKIKIIQCEDGKKVVRCISCHLDYMDTIF